MIKIIKQLDAGKYIVLCLDAPVPNINYKKLVIEEKEYEPVTVYDLPKSIAIKEKGDFVGKEIKFV